MTNHITASRERIADKIQQHFFTNGATVSKRDYDHVASILLQHEAVVREEVTHEIVGEIGAKLLAKHSPQAILDSYFDAANELLEDIEANKIL